MVAKTIKVFADDSRGASVLEVILAMAIVAMATPFVYLQISRTNRDLQSMALANKIVSVRDNVLNFVRVNQDDWPQEVQIRMTDEELQTISPNVNIGFIDKYAVKGASVTDVYLAFDMAKDELQANSIVKHIGDDAAIVVDGGVAYGKNWAVGAPDFIPGQIIYKISRDITGEDRTKYLHRGTAGEDNLNMMLRDLNMGNNQIIDIGVVNAESAKIPQADTTFVNTPDLVASDVYFNAGANLNSSKSIINTMRVSGDVSGFRNIYVNTLNNKGHTISGRIIADKAMVVNSIDVANDMVLKPSSVRSISGFTFVSTGSAYIPYLTTQNLTFIDNFGLTVSGELLMSSTAPIKIGNWSFPSASAPKFSELNISRAKILNIPKKSDFTPLFDSGWRTIKNEPK